MLLFTTSLTFRLSQFFFISIHLMLLFIFLVHKYHPFRKKFQYISCYCLSITTVMHRKTTCISIHLMLLFILLIVFFITIYFLFQYISCYCLSKGLAPVRKTLTKFQYISCYCLSAKTDHKNN